MYSDEHTVVVILLIKFRNGTNTVGAVIRVAAKIKVAALLTSILQYLKIKIRFFSFCNVNLSMLRTIINKKQTFFLFFIHKN